MQTRRLAAAAIGSAAWLAIGQPGMAAPEIMGSPNPKIKVRTNPPPPAPWDQTSYLNFGKAGQMHFSTNAEGAARCQEEGTRIMSMLKKVREDPSILSNVTKDPYFHYTSYWHHFKHWHGFRCQRYDPPQVEPWRAIFLEGRGLPPEGVLKAREPGGMAKPQVDKARDPGGFAKP
jgi:hypothetical protein